MVQRMWDPTFLMLATGKAGVAKVSKYTGFRTSVRSGGLHKRDG